MPRHDTLWNRLESARPDELHGLAGILGLHDPKGRSHAALVEEISRELRSAAGHSFANLFRDAHDLPYKVIVVDVAGRLAGSLGSKGHCHRADDFHTAEEVEETAWDLYSRLLEKELAKMPDGQREELLRSSLSKRPDPGLGEHLAVGAAGAVGRLLPKLPPAVGVAVLLGVLPFLAWEFGGTNFKKTIPAVVWLIQMRKLREAERDL